MKKILIQVVLLTAFSLQLLQANENQNITLADFAERVSFQNNINIYIDENIEEKTVSLFVPDDISNEDILSLFKSTVSKLDFNLQKLGSTYYLSKKIVVVEADKNYMYKLKYNSAPDCIKVLDILKVPYTYMEDINSFIITTTKDKYKETEEFLTQADSNQKQVILKIMILEFQETNKHEEGFKFGSIYENISGATEYALNTLVAPLNTNNLTLSNIDFYNALSLLNEDKKINVKQFPYVLAKNNKTFKFEAVENIPYLVTSTKTEATNRSEQNSIEYKDIGLKINGKSLIYEDYITLELDLIIEDIISNTPANTPQTYKRHLASNTDVAYNKVLLLSGIKRNKIDTTNLSIPYLSNIPYLGEIFKHEYKSDTELNITISIEVIKSDENSTKM